MSELAQVFVYGTLQRGESRERCWPCTPLQVTPAWTRGQLYDLGDYPALHTVASDPQQDWIAGELWSFSPEQMPRVLIALDQIEGYRLSQCDLYRRVCQFCDWSQTGFDPLSKLTIDPLQENLAAASIARGWAYTYHDARPHRLDERTRIPASREKPARWSGIRPPVSTRPTLPKSEESLTSSGLNEPR